MSLPTLEIVCGPASEAVRKNPHDRELVEPLFSLLKEQEGLLKSYYGLQHEDQKTTYHIAAWESYEHYKQFVENTAILPKLGKASAALLEAGSGRPQIIHVQPKGEPYQALEAPVIELAIVTAFDPQSMPTLNDLVAELFSSMDEIDGLFGYTWGPTVAKEDVLIGIVGWASLEALAAGASSNPKVREIIGEVMEIAKIDMCHVALLNLC